MSTNQHRRTTIKIKMTQFRGEKQQSPESTILTKLLVARHAPENVGIAGINNAHATHSVEFPTCSSQIIIASTIVVNTHFRQHSIILNLRLPERWAVVGNYNQLSFGVSEGLENGLVPQGEFATLHDQSQPVVDALMSLLRLLRRHHCYVCSEDGGPRFDANLGFFMRKKL
ncbi:hypothetical protein SKA94_15150, partial [Enterococcus faecium]